MKETMTQPLILHAYDPDEMIYVAENLLKKFPDQRIFTLTGDLGAGKTTFVKAFARELGIDENISSPTFSIVHEYGSGAEIIYHFDLYRLKNELELFEIGFEEYLDGEHYVLIEWPELAQKFLPEQYVSLQFEVEDENSRRIICSIENA